MEQLILVGVVILAISIVLAVIVKAIRSEAKEDIVTQINLASEKKKSSILNLQSLIKTQYEKKIKATPDDWDSLKRVHVADKSSDK